MTAEQKTQKPGRPLAEVFATATPGRTYDLGRAVPNPNGVFLRTDPAAVRALADTINRALLPQMAESYRQVQSIFEAYARAQMQAAGTVEAINRIVANAVSQFDGEDWARLGQRLSATAQPAAVQTAAEIPTPTIITDSQVPTEKPTEEPANRPDLLVEWARSLALLAAALYFVNFTAAEEVFGPELLARLQDNVIAAFGLYGAVLVWASRRGR